MAGDSNGIGDMLAIKFEEAAIQSLRDFLPDIELALYDIQQDVSNEFYSSYSPIEYDRTWSLYNALDVSTNEEDITMSYEFIPEDMTTYRSGYDGEDGLYDLVFRQGWHGGAKSGDKHPSSGTPYWRKPIPFYSHWGRQAERAPITPLKNWERKKEEYENEKMINQFASILNKEIRKMLG